MGTGDSFSGGGGVVVKGALYDIHHSPYLVLSFGIRAALPPFHIFKALNKTPLLLQYHPLGSCNDLAQVRQHLI